MQTINSYKSGSYWLIIIGLLCTLSARATEYGSIEKKKSVIKMYDVSTKETLLIDNQFGQVKVNLWDKSEIRVDISITANANSDDRVQQYLDGVSIEDKKEGNQISIRTIINKNGNSNWSWKSNNGEKNFVQIDYTVSMPKNTPLTVKNRFGNTNIPFFKAPLVIESKYGSFIATDLSGSKNDIDVAYGKAEIQHLLNGNLDIAYSTLELDKANNIVLNNKFGKMKIGEVETLDGQISYSGGRIGNLKGSSKIKLSFSGGFRIDQLNESADNVDIQASYSSVTIPMENNDCNFDVTVSYGGFKYPGDRKVSFTHNDDDRKDDANRHSPRMTKQYVGKFGNGSGTKVKIVSKYGEVNLR
ncbi:hypothetical protein GVN20_13055 [Runella sp. CRIBMP]|uniref:DUF4097 domain-containing protein n=1 Tax=Runella sp. CRIBMP TaxID=2683261 RepID=UPI0014128D80|nr:DUF4097 domain-containing protein [Runella sp. CRIBMP]NBB20286.1 hypothetical protein [Runella sp. CRIBMP]